jgi:pimeloyl-ACP methyl ester carboxylesterase
MRWLLLRGLIRESRHWLDFPDYFAKHVVSRDGHQTEVLFVDLPGFGTQNEAPVPETVPAFVDDMRARLRPQLHDGEKIGICAVSLGMVALSWLARFPEDFHCGVIINSSLGDVSPLWHRMRPKNWPNIFRAPFMSAAKRERMLLSMTRHQGDLDKDAARYAEIASDVVPKPKNAVAQIRAAIKVKSPTSITVPTVVLASVADELVSWRCSEAIAKRLSLPLKLHDGTGKDAAGHDLPVDQPGWVCDRINELTATLSLSPASSSSSSSSSGATSHA